MYTHLQYFLFFFFSSKYLKSLITEKTTNDMDKIMTGTTEISVSYYHFCFLCCLQSCMKKESLKVSFSHLFVVPERFSNGSSYKIQEASLCLLLNNDELKPFKCSKITS